ncbi:hypothetical protein JTE90_012535 [Oedothorax gibbosus]|uniref:SMB domain-containing protein n=1 Tax=Oedothorax gibbosus TaxID=931172 RepID=A0AAV6U623_9ARAC|nr:hypothetical protein JTE90_012535 [Oedothorax gibbosus]
MPKKQVIFFDLILLVASLLDAIRSEDAFCGNKCFGQGVVISRSCFCDKACSVYNDCCADSEFLNGPSNNTSPLHLPKSVLCKRNALVVNSCVKEWNGPDFIVKSCKSVSVNDVDPVGNAPVTSEASGVTYSNYFCAICNGDAEKLIMWNIKMSCPMLNPDIAMDTAEAFKYIFYNHPTNEWGYVLKDDDTKKMSFHGCAVTAEIPEQHAAKVRRCSSQEEQVKDLEVKTCATTWKKDVVQDMCGTYTDPVFSNGTRYKNFYCAICNRVDLSKMSCGEAIGPRTHHKQPDSSSDDNTNKLSFSLLLDINFSEGNIVGKRIADVTCLKGEVFDPFARRCRNIVCGIPGYILQNGMCMAEPVLPPLL